MPQKLKEFLANLDPETADRVWAFLDGEPDAIHQMIEVVVKCHHWDTEKE